MSICSIQPKVSFKWSIIISLFLQELYRTITKIVWMEAIHSLRCTFPPLDSNYVMPPLGNQGYPTQYLKRYFRRARHVFFHYLANYCPISGQEIVHVGIHFQININLLDSNCFWVYVIPTWTRKVGHIWSTSCLNFNLFCTLQPNLVKPFSGVL